MHNNEGVQQNIRYTEYLTESSSRTDGVLKVLEDIFNADHNPQLNSQEKQRRDKQQIEEVIEMLFIILKIIDRIMENDLITQQKETMELEEANLKFENEKQELINLSIQDMQIAKQKLEKLIDELNNFLRFILNLIELKQEFKKNILNCFDSIQNTSNINIKVNGVELEINFKDVVSHLKRTFSDRIDAGIFDSKNLSREFANPISDYISKNILNLNEFDRARVVSQVGKTMQDRFKNGSCYSEFEKIREKMITFEEGFKKYKNDYKVNLNADARQVKKILENEIRHQLSDKHKFNADNNHSQAFILKKLDLNIPIILSEKKSEKGVAEISPIGVDKKSEGKYENKTIAEKISRNKRRSFDADPPIPRAPRLK